MPVVRVVSQQERLWPDLSGLDRNDFLILNITNLNVKALTQCSEAFYADIEALELHLRKELNNVNGRRRIIFGKKCLRTLLKVYLDTQLDRLCRQLGGNAEILSASLALQSTLRFNGFLNQLNDMCQKSYDKVEKTPSVQHEYIYQELSYIRALLIIFNGHLNYYSPPTYCHICFRKTQQRKYCHLHKSTSNEFHLNKKTLSAYRETLEVKGLLAFRKRRYEITGERIHDGSDPIMKLSGEYWAITFSKLLNSIPTVRGYVIDLCKSTVDSLAETLHFSFTNFSECIQQLYRHNKFDNRCETDYSPYAVMTTLYLAEAWFVAELELGANKDGREKDNAVRNEMIMDYVGKGDSLRKISSKLQAKGYKLGKSGVAKVIDANTLNV